MSAQPKDLYGEDNTVAITTAIRYASETRTDKDCWTELTREDVKSALCAICDDPAWLDDLRSDYRDKNEDEGETDAGRTLFTQFDIQRALRLRQAMP